MHIEEESLRKFIYETFQITTAKNSFLGSNLVWPDVKTLACWSFFTVRLFVECAAIISTFIDEQGAFFCTVEIGERRAFCIVGIEQVKRCEIPY